MKIVKLAHFCLAMLFLAIFTHPLSAQLLDYENSLEVVLQDGTNVKLFGRAILGGGTSKDYYYLPPASTLRLSQNQEGTPEFLFIKYTTEETIAAGGVQGALIHFLVQWGLTPAQLEDLRAKVAEKFQGQVLGPVELTAEGDHSYRIVSATLNGNEQLITSGRAPTTAGDRAAVASKMDKNAAQLLTASFEKTRSITDVSLVLDYSYSLLTPAARGSITFDWSRLERMGEQLAIDYLQKELDGNPKALQEAKRIYEDGKKNIPNACGMSDSFGQLLQAGAAADKALGNRENFIFSNNEEYYAGEQAFRNAYRFMEEKEVIKINWDENIDDERIGVIREAFFSLFLNSFTEKAPPYSDAEKLSIENPDMERIRNRGEAAYQFKGCEKLTTQMRKFREIRLDNIRLAVKKSHQMVSNLATTYDHVRDNPKCVTSVNLNDPFYTHREISVVLDLATRDLFDKEINDVVVEIRKRRSDGRDFQNNVKFNSENIKKEGVVQSLTYAREGDNNIDVFEYKTKWSLRNGYTHEDPVWKKGDWASISVMPPVIPRMIELEADLEELRESRISRMTVQIRYLKFGEEQEEEIHVSPGKNLAISSQTIFVDRDTRGYAYRLIVNHKDEGKLVLPWQEKINDNYIYAVIPKKLREGDQSFIGKLRQNVDEAGDLTKDILNKSGTLKDAIKDAIKNLFGSDAGEG